jgi:endoglucanase
VGTNRDKEDDMERRPKRRARAAIVVAALAGLIVATPVGAADPPSGLDDDTQLSVPKPNHAAREQIAALRASGARDDAERIVAMIETPQANWIEGGSPKQATQDVRAIVSRANDKGTVPVLVAYNIPFRDCAQFSAGGATSPAEYNTWIDGFAAGIGTGEAIVILEPDGLGIIPWYDPYGGADGSRAPEWCQPAEASPATASADRFAMLNHAVDAFAALPHVRVYLDGTHSAWLGVGDAAHRLAQAGVERADGFFLNVSNYQFTWNSVQYGTWVSQCLAYATTVNPGDFFGCPNQYWNGGPFPAKIADLLGEWTGVALSPYGVWSDASDTAALNTSGLNLRYANMLGGAAAATRFVVDTSRNGHGPWQPPAGEYPDPQDWCNPPGRGLGVRPTAATGSDLLDAYLWVKTPGESDGECTRGEGPAGTTVDPEWGIIDPRAGAWFSAQALELARLAIPALDTD